MTIGKYFDIVHRLLERHWAVDSKNVTYKSFAKEDGKISGRIVLIDGSYIDFAERVFISDRRLLRGRYRYQYMKDDEIFRYDNYPKHPGISPPFHHKHSSTGIIQLDAAPKLIDIIEEAVRHMFLT